MLPQGGAPQQATLVREPIALRAAQWAVCRLPPAEAEPEQELAYIRLPSFSAATAGSVRDALASLGAARFPASLLLDLRDNGGGSFPAAVDVARLLLPARSTIVYIADSDGVRDAFDAPAEPELPADVRLSVLVNRGTASAAEVLAAALRDNGRAALLGEKTFGKGIIQTTVALSDSSGVNVTVAKYQTPSGRDINKVGIQPDRGWPLPAAPARPEGFCEALRAQPGGVRAALAGG